MKKRDFIKKTIAGSALLMGGGLNWGCANESKKENIQSDEEFSKLDVSGYNGQKLPDNWVWLRPDMETTDDEWKRHFDRVKEAGIDAVLPQVYNGTDPFFDHPRMQSKGNILERLIPIAHNAGLEIHAWMWTMICNNPKILKEHPDWYAVNRNGDPANTYPAYVNYYKFMCPAHPEVREFVGQNVDALARIKDLDGVHIDYVRLPDVILAKGLQPKYNIEQDSELPEYDYCYSDLCREQFKEKTGIDPMNIKDPASHREWVQYRQDIVADLVNNYAVPAAKKYKKSITAAVFPNWEAVRQRWHTFDLDGFLPMLYQGFYNEDIAWIGKEIKAAKERLNNSKPVYSGLFINHLKPEEIELAIQVSRQNGAKGVSFFALDSLTDAHWDAVTRALKKD